MVKKSVYEYIWIDSNNELRSKSRTLINQQPNVVDLPIWNFDGSSTGQAENSKSSEVILNPVAIFRDPFRKLDQHYENDCYLVLCECDDINNNPLGTRRNAKEIFDMGKEYCPLFGLEQEYVLYDALDNKILGWPKDGSFPPPQGQYYCGIGANNAFGRNIVDEHYNKCLYAGLEISGVNAEVLPGQWEFQIGTALGIDAGDQLWIARYILERVAEKYNVYVSYNPKPVEGDWNGSGLHTNFSTQQMRKDNGISYIYSAMAKLAPKHNYLLHYCGNNEKRLSGTHETSNKDKFTYGVGDRTASVRIPNSVYDTKCGYFEYRVPASDADPYLVTSKLFAIVCL